MSIDNGSVVDVVFHAYTGRAGMAIINGQREICFPGRAVDIAKAKSGMVAGKRVDVTGFRQSSIPGMVVVYIGGDGDV